MTIDVRHGDCLEVLPTLEADSIDACVTDPPYHLTSGKKGGTGVASLNINSPADRSRVTTGFMGKKWDGGDVAFRPETWAAVWRVLKPGAHLLAFSGTRTYHRMVCAIEDAGFEIRDQLAWVYGNGFPKSHDISKAIDKMAGGGGSSTDGATGKGTKTILAYGDGLNVNFEQRPQYIPSTDAAKQWSGWGTALKPAWEPIVLARKPLAERTIAAQVLATGTGALNIDECRIGARAEKLLTRNASIGFGGSNKPQGTVIDGGIGRWPANICHDGSPEVLAEFAKFGESNSTQGKPRGAKAGDGWGMTATGAEYADTGTPARFFASFPHSGDDRRFYYSGKAGADDRLGSKHPTVKPTGLMRWLVRMVTPPGGCVLDPFGGSGATAMACMAEGFDAVLIELEAQSVADINRRLAHVEGADTPLFSSTQQGSLL